MSGLPLTFHGTDPNGSADTLEATTAERATEIGSELVDTLEKIRSARTDRMQSYLRFDRDEPICIARPNGRRINGVEGEPTGRDDGTPAYLREAHAGSLARQPSW